MVVRHIETFRAVGRASDQINRDATGERYEPISEEERVTQNKIHFPQDKPIAATHYKRRQSAQTSYGGLINQTGKRPNLISVMVQGGWTIRPTAHPVCHKNTYRNICLMANRRIQRVKEERITLYKAQHFQIRSCLHSQIIQGDGKTVQKYLSRRNSPTSISQTV
ncbi:Hypothetical_protein [Hexamita inflata]|uniref:Hypothetical_protein n=1 Tax=Hexamita inflata TaxID=28002 RepID=A0AA86RQ57_9EUKA|nr:Hypothetical protein HINF_LOCUS66523 [Hexamita inflata]